MARRNRNKTETKVQDYRHDAASRRNNPPAGLASQGIVGDVSQQEYAYNPHLPPVLRFDSTGQADALPELLQEAQRRVLTADETQLLAEALRHQEPWLEWAGKQEQCSFSVDPVALNIHERVSAKAIMEMAKRNDIQRDLFADPEQEYREAVQFYQHDVDWSNRLILGDSLQVMSSLAHREDLTGSVQMVYIDPPYGIKYSSNFQPTVFQRDVKDREQDLSRETEQIKAYRDTWTLGIHSYLAYMRDRLIIAKELLTDSGSIFVQIGSENVHLVRVLLAEVFGRENFCSQIAFFKTTSQTSNLVPSTCDYLLWYAKNKALVKYNQLFLRKTVKTDKAGVYSWISFPDGFSRRMSATEKSIDTPRGKHNRIFSLDNLTSQSGGESTNFSVSFRGQTFTSGKGFWKTNEYGLTSLIKAERIGISGVSLRYIRYMDDFPCYPISNLWNDTGTGSFTDPKTYIVQTARKVLSRCILMTTDPGDLVLDPTCGGGTTAYVAEQWGRRWIAIDTSRVAIALTRQRLLTSTYDYYKLKSKQYTEAGFVNKRVPHITLKSIAQNTALDPIFDRYEPILAEKLDMLNLALEEVTQELKNSLLLKLQDKEKREGKKAVTDADRRRWKLPSSEWQEWEVPFDFDSDWPEVLQEALTDYRKAWRNKMDEVNECIAASNEGEELVDQPEIDKSKLRVTGPFTVEAVQPAEESLDLSADSPISSLDQDLDTFEDEQQINHDATNAEAYLSQMIQLLKGDGVRFPDNQLMKFETLDPLEGDILHAEGAWAEDTMERLVAVVIGPQHGPVTATLVENCLRIASRRGYDELVFAGFSFDGAAQAAIQEDPNPSVRVHMAHIRPDVVMGDLLKDTPTSQLFTVFGLPRTQLERNNDGQYTVTMEGVDIYNPVDNTVNSSGADKVAAWFVDSDYDGRTFCITQAFFPDKSAWTKIAKALKSIVDPERFNKFSGTQSLPFPAGQHQCVAVKVIDPRGNEVMRIHQLA